MPPARENRASSTPYKAANQSERPRPSRKTKTPTPPITVPSMVNKIRCANDLPTSEQHAWSLLEVLGVLVRPTLVQLDDQIS